MNMIRQAGMYPFHDESANDYIVFVNDIKATIQQVVVGNELQNALKSMRNMMNYSFEAICILDRYGRITAFNELAEKMFDGSKTKEFYGKYFWEMVLEVAEEDVKDVVEKGQGFYSRMIKIGDQMGLMNIMPSSREKEANGAVVHFMTLQQIDNLEAQVKNEYYKKGHYAKYTFKDITGTSASMMKTMRLAKRFAGYQSNVLLYGESGCGKELFAQSIHNDSMRANQPFVAINAGSLPTNMLESELFGYVEGAFTGASKKGKKGLFEIANKGTIFLDEISEIDAQGQTRLLRVLEERCVMRIGDDKIIPVDVRVIAASNKSLAKLVQEGKFREDLYYRLNVLTLNIPPLRERGEDALLIADRYLEYYGRKFHKQVFLSEGAKHAILQCPWKGNVRQLRNFCEYLVVVADQPEISEQEVWEQLQATEMAVYDDRTATEKNSTNEMKIKVPEKNGFKPPISSRSITAEDIQMALDVAEGKKDKTAALLGISKATLWRKMKQFHME